MMHHRILHIIIPIIFTMVLSISCKHKETEYHSLTDKIEEEGKNYEGTTISSEVYLGEMNLMEITEGTHTFLIPERKSQLKSFECTECHSRPLNALLSEEKDRKAHWNIKLVHANEATMNCITCHDGKNMNNLASLTGTDIDFNMSYKLCSQCHSAQFEDWKGGAHGKRIAGWAPPRASMTCVNCHNPHNPGFGSRWPTRFNTQMEKERKEGLSH